METTLICKNCSTINPFYQLTCSKCSAYLRERIYNIDLWHVLVTLIESPSKAYARIIQADHKNFILLIFIFASVKLSINSSYLSLALLGERHNPGNAILLFLITSVYLMLSAVICSLLYKRLNDNRTRFKDNFAVIVYSLFPYVFALVILFPFEIILFGYTVFSVNPSPFIVKETLAYVMLSFEVLFILWAIFLSFMAFRRQSSDKRITILFCFLFNFLLYCSMFLIAVYYF